MTKDGGIGVKVVVGLTSLIGLGIVVYRLVKPLLGEMDEEHPGPIIAAVGAVVVIGAIVVWRWRAHRRSVVARIRRRD